MPSFHRQRSRQHHGGRETDAAPSALSASADVFLKSISVDPHERFILENPGDFSMRAVDLIAPIGRGQRALLVAPPKAGKTVLLQKIAHALARNHPEVKVFVLLIDERPEEVTDMRRSVPAEVHAASSDEHTREHVRLADELRARALDLAGRGEDVVVLLDSITRLARAHNSQQRGAGKILSGGLDARTMEVPRKFFGSARKAEGSGSLTLVATALIDTGSRLDEVIFEEFKGTGNMELVLSRALFERRIFPAVDIAKSGTRKEEKLWGPEATEKLHKLRRHLAGLNTQEAMEKLLTLLQRYPTNAELLAALT
jgi:transcription termination factor Rho